MSTERPPIEVTTIYVDLDDPDAFRPRLKPLRDRARILLDAEIRRSSASTRSVFICGETEEEQVEALRDLARQEFEAEREDAADLAALDILEGDAAGHA